MTHRLQLFDTPDTLASGVSSFLADGYKAGGNLLIIAKARNRAAILARLHEAGCFAQDAGRQRVVALDADEVLQQLSRNGELAGDQFQSLVAPLVGQLAATGQLWIYGEIVELLAERGDFAAAHQLEQLWNELSALFPFALLCGYSSAHFCAEPGRAALANICGTHTHASATLEDMIGYGLLASA